jgi:hypothetical protein
LPFDASEARRGGESLTAVYDVRFSRSVSLEQGSQGSGDLVSFQQALSTCVCEAVESPERRETLGDE